MDSEASAAHALVSTVLGSYAEVDAPFDANTMRARHEASFGPGIEDLMSLAGHPTPTS